MTLTDKPLVVGIAGGTASGKSTFTKVLLQTLAQKLPDARIVDLHTDRYFRVGAPDMPTFVSPTSKKTMLDFNHPDTIDSRRLVADTDALVQADDTPDIVVVEGQNTGTSVTDGIYAVSYRKKSTSSS